MLDSAGGDEGREKIAGSCDDAAAAVVVPNFGKLKLADILPDAGDWLDPNAGDWLDPNAGDWLDPNAGVWLDPNAGDWLDPKPAVMVADGWPDPNAKGNGPLAAADAA